MALILALEDDRLSQRLIQKVFKNAGHEVLTAASIKEGLALLRSRVLVDLVVLDSHLGTELGWDFVAEVRRRPLFRQLPIIVYTGYTERQEVLRYATLKVQAVHVKPIKAEVLLGELARATAQGERGEVLPDSAEVCARLKIALPEYAALLVTAVTHFEEDHDVVNRHLGQPRAPELAAALQRLKSRAREFGVRLIEEMAALIGEQVQNADHAAATETSLSLDAVVMAVRQRAVAMMGSTGAMLAAGSAGLPLPHLPATPPPPLPSSDLIGAMARQVIDRPMAMFVGRFGRLRGAQLSIADLRAACAAEKTDGPVNTWLEAIAIVHDIARSDVPDAARLLADIKGFAEPCRRILRRTRQDDVDQPEADEEADFVAAATRLGVVPTIVLAALAKLVRAPLTSPLELQPLRQHVAVTALLAFELGRLLGRPEPHELAAAAIAQQLGVWTLAVTEPGLTAIALAQAGAGLGLAESIEMIFGFSSADVGRAVLETRLTYPLYLDTVAAGERPESAPNVEAQVAATLVRLAANLACAATVDGPQELKAVRSQLLQPDCPIWGFLRERGVAVPLDVTEIVEVVVTLSASATWTVREAMG